MDVTHPTPSFGHWLRQHRKNLDLTQEELAQRIGCSDIAIRKIEAGVRRPSRQVAELLADLFKVPVEEREAFIGFARGVDTGKEEPPPTFYDAASGPASEMPLVHNLPAQLTRLIGREEDATEIGSYLLQDDIRLLTLTGPPGIGKTRLALRVGSDLTGHFEDGVFLVLLASISDPNLVALAVAQTLGVRETGSTPITVSLTQYLRYKRALLVLDNFEQVVVAAPAVVNILETCPRVKVMVTSREPLHVRGEQVFVVPPLQLPDLAHVHTIEALLCSPAVALFVERARALEPDFDLTEQNCEAVAAICVRLEGLPLAIELAAARVRILTSQEIMVRLDSRLKLLSGGLRGLSARQRTLRGAIDWSYALLSHAEQKLFVRLSVFVGGFALPTAEAVCNSRGDLPFDVLDAIDSLLDKSLLKREEVLGESRYTMLEMIREYALNQLEQRGEADSIRRVHAEYYLALVEATEAGLRGPDQPRLLARLETERDNIGASLRWAREKGGETSAEAREAADIGLRIGVAARYFWLLKGYYSEGRGYLEGLLSLSPPQAELSSHSKELRAKALAVIGRLAFRQGDYSAARLLFEKRLAFSREVGDKQAIAWSLADLAMVAIGHGDYSTARSLEEEGLTLQRELGNKLGIQFSLGHLGNVAFAEGDYSSARQYFEESLALNKELGNKSSISILLYELGIVVYMEGDYSKARPLFEESLILQIELGYKVGIAMSLAGLGEVTADTGQPRRGTRLMGASEGLYESIGGVMEASDRIPYDRALASARSQLGDEDFETAWQEGQAMSLEQAIEYALEGTRAG
jgi:predicted ATPase/DNA-binding XRE family transcriptional regulator